METIERDYGELQKYHNEALKDVNYRMEGLLEARMEEMMANIPTFEEPVEVATPQEPWSLAQTDIVNQLRLGFAYLNSRFANLEKEVKERTSKKGRYKDYQ